MSPVLVLVLMCGATAEPPATGAESPVAGTAVPPASAELPAADAEQSVTNGAAPATNGEIGKSGRNGWGLGLEAPLVGVLTGAAKHSRLGWGYTLGGAVAYEVTPAVLIRLTVRGGQTYNGRANVSYVETGHSAPSEAALDAEWAMIEAALGGAYLWREVARGVAIYAGGDAGARFGGYNFHFDDRVASLAAVDIGNILSRCTAASCKSTIHDAIGLGFTGSVRGGVRLDLAPMLMAQPELALTYTRTNADRVSNTVETRDVRGVAEHALLVLVTFTVRLGL
ncbi:MAG: hypothetical protein HY903_06400 [Deltaproteobacteria bacterium]|nr:hypothetical protein [Deltaproteobacteria bacterium]